MSATLQGAAYYLPISASEKLTLCALADHANDEGSGIWPGNERLATKTSQSTRNLRRVLRSLEKQGLIARVANAGGGRGKAVEYAINADEVYRVARENGWAQRSERAGKASPFPRPPAEDDGKEDTGVPVSETERRTPSARKEDIQTERRTSETLKEDTGVPPTVREPSEQPPVEPFPALRAAAPVEIVSETSQAPGDLAETGGDALPARTRQRDPIFETVAAVCFGADDWTGLTSRERGMANRACKELRAVGATPDDIADRARNFIAWVGQRPTPDNLVTHWNRLREPVQRLPRQELEVMAEEQVMAARVRAAQVRERHLAEEAAARAAQAAEVVPIRQLGPDPAVSPSKRHPRRPGESMREYVARIGRIGNGAERPGDRDEEAG